jgi:long-chain acyl-CoA synthetase
MTWYSIGSTGVPKGVKITHKNLMKSCSAYKLLVDHVLDTRDQQLYIAYLPLAHILELITETILFVVGIRIGYSTPNTLTDLGTAIRKGDKGDATLLRPTVMGGVPLVLDRIRKGIMDKINRKGLIAKKLFEFVVDYKAFWTKKGYSHIICKLIFVFKTNFLFKCRF